MGFGTLLTYEFKINREYYRTTFKILLLEERPVLVTKERPYPPLLTGVETLPGVVAGAARAVDAEDEEVGPHFGGPEESHPLLDLPDGELQHGQRVRET